MIQQEIALGVFLCRGGIREIVTYLCGGIRENVTARYKGGGVGKIVVFLRYVLFE